MGHGSRHKRRSLCRELRRELCWCLAVVTFGGAIFHFSYTAYESSQCYTADSTESFSTESHAAKAQSIRTTAARSLPAAKTISGLDAAIAVLAIVLIVGAAVRLSKASRRTRRLVLVAEVAVVTIGVVYTILLASALPLKTLPGEPQTEPIWQLLLTAALN